VKAIAIAAANGQKVYTLNAQNQAYHAGIVAGLGTDADTKAEIANALNAGMEVTVHQADITAHGWTGSGYIILDPETGAGAYKISGGANGAILALFIGALLAVFGLFFAASVAGIVVLVGGFALMLAALLELFQEQAINLFDLALYAGLVRVMGLIAGIMLVPFEAVPTLLVAIVVGVIMSIVMLSKKSAYTPDMLHQTRMVA
jgi:hypothetical protein